MALQKTLTLTSGFNAGGIDSSGFDFIKWAYGPSKPCLSLKVASTADSFIP